MCSRRTNGLASRICRPEHVHGTVAVLKSMPTPDLAYRPDSPRGLYAPDPINLVSEVSDRTSSQCSELLEA